MKITVVGMGKIGLPLAVQYATMGHTVTGIDLNYKVVELVNSGQTPFPGEFQLQEKLEELIPKGLLRATNSYEEAIPEADAVIVVVPLLVDEETWQPDFTWLDSATQSIAENLTSDTLISYETTLPVGTTRNRWKPMLESISELKEGKDFHLVYSPERVLTGRVFADLRKYPKLFGAFGSNGAKLAESFYQSVLSFDERNDLNRPNGVWDLGSPEAAEMAKLAETTYRDVNIGLANQFAVYADKIEIDIYKVIEACNSQPFSHIHKPGIAVGGHCIPVYPRLYLSTDPDAEIVRIARNLNASMPEYLVSRAECLLGSLSGIRAAVFGASYRGGVKETAVSGVFPTVAALVERGAEVFVYDPLYSDQEIRNLGFVPFSSGEEIDVLIIQADHIEFNDLRPSDFPNIRLLVDGRNQTSKKVWDGVPRISLGG